LRRNGFEDISANLRELWLQRKSVRQGGNQSCSRPAGRFSQFQSYDLLVQQNIFLLDDPVHVVMPEEVVFELAPPGNFVKEIRQRVSLIKSAAQFIRTEVEQQWVRM
jgi:hypothetical protein